MTIRFLLTSAGIKNKSIKNALVSLLGEPISDADALVSSPRGTDGCSSPDNLGPVRRFSRQVLIRPLMHLHTCGRRPFTSGRRPHVHQSAQSNTRSNCSDDVAIDV